MTPAGAAARSRRVPADRREGGRASAAIEVELVGRSDALALYERLIRYHAYLVQYDRERWCVHAQAPGWRGETLPAALELIESCLADRGIRPEAVRVDGDPTSAIGTSNL